MQYFDGYMPWEQRLNAYALTIIVARENIHPQPKESHSTTPSLPDSQRQYTAPRLQFAEGCVKQVIKNPEPYSPAVKKYKHD